ncbi:hypothetical protein DFH09DRAFT_1280114 [Mycena vulgaris]|nr:hypothetical protein DFH09DRAFT_1280114 [Mycena vulgaris]
MIFKNDFIVDGTLSISVYDAEASESEKYPHWAFPVGESKFLPTWRRALWDPAHWVKHDTPRIPDFTQGRITVGDCIAIAALAEGFLGVDISTEQQSTCPIPTYKVVWFKQGEDPRTAPALTSIELSRPLSEFSDSPWRGLWIVGSSSAENDDEASGQAIKQVVDRDLASIHRRSKLAAANRSTAFRDIISTQSGGGKCMVTGSTYASEAAHIIAHSLGAPLLMGVVGALKSASKAFSERFVADDDELEDVKWLFADARLPHRQSMPTLDTPAGIDDPANGYMLAADLHNAKDRRKRLTINPVNHQVLWLDQTAAEERPVVDCGYIASNKKSTHLPLPADDPRNIVVLNTNGVVPEIEEYQFFLMCIDMMLTFANRYMTAYKRKSIHQRAVELLSKRGSRRGNGRRGAGAGRARSHGNAGGRGDTSGGSGGNRDDSGEEDDGDKEEKEEEKAGESAAKREDEGPPRKRARTGSPGPSIPASSSNESNKTLVGMNLGHAKALPVVLGGLLEEIVQVTPLPSGKIVDNEEVFDSPQHEELYDALLDRYPGRVESIEELYGFHQINVENASLLLNMLANISGNIVQ